MHKAQGTTWVLVEIIYREFNIIKLFMARLLKRYLQIFVVLLLLMQIVQNMNAQEVKLPAVDGCVGKPFMQTVADRRSVREFDKAAKMPEDVLGQLLWAAVGVNRTDAATPAPGKLPVNRSNPTALNCQEITAYVFGENGVWEYLPQTHAIRRVAEGDYRRLVAGDEGFSQDFVLCAPYSVVFVADTGKLPESPRRNILAALDAGIACENFTLACSALGVATVPRATMNVAEISRLLELGSLQIPMLNNPIGYAR